MNPWRGLQPAASRLVSTLVRGAATRSQKSVETSLDAAGTSARATVATRRNRWDTLLADGIYFFGSAVQAVNHGLSRIRRFRGGCRRKISGRGNQSGYPLAERTGENRAEPLLSFFGLHRRSDVDRRAYDGGRTDRPPP